MYEEVVEKGRRNVAEAYNNIGSIYFAEGIYEEAESAYRKSIKTGPHLLITYINLGDILSAQQNYKEAINVYKDGLEINPHSAKIHSGVGYCYYRMNIIDKALEAYQKVLQFEPNTNLGRLAAHQIKALKEKQR